MVSDSAFGTRAEAPASAACSPSGSTRGADSPARPDDDGEPDPSGRAHDDVRRARSPPASRAAVDDVDAHLASFTRRVDAILRAMDAFDAEKEDEEFCDDGSVHVQVIVEKARAAAFGDALRDATSGKVEYRVLDD